MLWGEATLTAAYNINLIPSPVIGNQSPHERLFDDGQNNDAQIGDGSLDSTEPIVAESSLSRSYADSPTNNLLGLFETGSNTATSSIPPIETSSTNLELRRSERVRQLPGYLSDYQLYAAVVCLYKPSTYREAKSDPFWQQAMEEELQALLKSHTWDLVEFP